MAQVKTATEMFPLVESRQKSGLTQKEFSQQLADARRAAAFIGLPSGHRNRSRCC
jgi:putative heme iron utilization protein